jgi:hypothetical protein
VVVQVKAMGVCLGAGWISGNDCLNASLGAATAVAPAREEQEGCVGGHRCSSYTISPPPYSHPIPLKHQPLHHHRALNASPAPVTPP